MNRVYLPYIDQFTIVFTNDIFIYSRTCEEYEQHLIIALQTPREHQLYAKFEKCDFSLTEVKFLKHVILGRGIVVGPYKIKAILN